MVPYQKRLYNVTLFYNDEKGKFSIVALSYNEKDYVLRIGERQGGFPGMLERRTFEIVWIAGGKPSGHNF